MKIERVLIKEPIVLRVLLKESVASALAGARFKTVFRHGPFLGLTFDNQLAMIVHPMLAGKFKLTTDTQKAGRGVCFSFLLSDTRTLHYLDDKKMGKAYLLQSGNYAQIPRFEQQGIDILSSGFTLEKFQALIEKQRKQVRVFLMDQTLLSAIGNAYADEILFDARLHPKTLCNQLAEQDVENLYNSVVTVMNWGIRKIKQAGQPIEVKVRGHVKVRNRKDQPCPRCDSIIRRAGVLGYDAFFCPICQPPKRKQFIEWK